MLKTRIITALVLLPLMLGALFGLGPDGWAAFAWLIVALGLWEWGRLFRYNVLQHAALIGAGSALAACSWLTAWIPMGAVHVVALVVWLALAPLWLYKRWKLENRLLAGLVGLALLVPAWFGFVGLRPTADIAWQLLAIMALVWLADTAAYFSGKAFGKHKLAPSISPGKSWEGVAGAMVGVTAYIVYLAGSGVFSFKAPLAGWLVVGWVLTAVSIVGDLLESWMKRAAGVKDSSSLLPGHGGVLDRIDSLIAVLAVSHAAKYFAGY